MTWSPADDRHAALPASVRALYPWAGRLFTHPSGLKQHVIGKVTREDHSQIMNTMIRFYAGARDAEQKQAMAFDLSEFDHQLLRFGRLFRRRFMDIEVALPLEEALDLCWKTLAECFDSGELLMRQHLIDKYYPHDAVRHDGDAAA